MSLLIEMNTNLSTAHATRRVRIITIKISDAKDMIVVLGIVQSWL